MPEKSYFTLDEKENVLSVYRQLLRNSRPVLRVEDFNRMRRLISEAVETGHYQRNKQGINPVVRNLNTALILCDRVGLERSMLISVLLFNLVVSEFLTIETVKKEFGDDIAQLIRGLIKSNSLYAKQAAVESENFLQLLSPPSPNVCCALSAQLRKRHPAVGEQSDYLAKQKKRHWDCNIHEGRKPVH